MIRGIDVSVVQGPVAWPAVAACGVAFAFVKVAEGATYRDPRAAANLAGARAAGLVVGAYNVVHPSAAADPAEQARTHHGAVQAVGGGLWGDLPHAIDFELAEGQGAAALAEWLAVYAAESRRLLGCPPPLYTFPAFWAPIAAVARVDAFADLPLWWASYRIPPRPTPQMFAPYHPIPKPWARARFWQWTDAGLLTGGVHVDGDLFDGTLEELRAMTLSAATSGLHPEVVPPDATPDEPTEVV